MASIKVKFKPSTVSGNEGTIYYQIIHERKIRQLFTGYQVFSPEWDEKRGNLCIGKAAERRSHINSLRDRIRWDIERLNRIINHFAAQSTEYTSEDVVNEFIRYSGEYSLFNFMEGLIVKLKQNSRNGTADNYRSALNSFKKFCHREDVMLDAVNTELMESYESWMKDKGIAPNTTSFYMRILRAVYNRAVDEDVIDDKNPFRRVYTGTEKTVKRALPFKMIKQIKQLDLSLNPEVEFARDMFLMSFYLRGMSFVDMAYLKKSDLRNGMVIYRRRKTGQQLTIAWEASMQQLLDKYPENKSDYLLPIIRNKGINDRKAYKNAGYNINHNLKQVAKQIGITMPLTLYVARHSWATAAKQHGASLATISEALGHDNETTTQIYLASLDTAAVDSTNALLLNYLSH